MVECAELKCTNMAIHYRQIWLSAKYTLFTPYLIPTCQSHDIEELKYIDESSQS